MTIQLAGNQNAGPSEVELNTLAMRFAVRPQDIGFLGSYAAGDTYTVVNQLTAQPSPNSNLVVASIRGPLSSGSIHLVRKLLISLLLSQQATGTGANTIFVISLIKAQNFVSQGITVQDSTPLATNPKQLSPSPTAQKLRGTMADPTLDVILPPDALAGHTTAIAYPAPQASAVELVAPVFGAANPLASVIGFGVNATTTLLIPQATPLFQQRAGELPLIIEPGTGVTINITSTLPTFATASGSLFFSLAMTWDEIQLGNY